MNALLGEERAIAETVDALRGDLFAFVQKIVRIPSVTGDEGAVQATIAEAMRDAGLETDLWEPDPAELAPYADDVGVFTSFAGRPNVVGRLAGSGGGRSLALNAHVDVVDAGDPSRWSHPPYAAEIEGGLLYGRGACDMKAGMAANLYAAIALIKAGVSLRGDLLVQSVVSEEDGGAGTLAAILRGYRADAAIIPEPTRLAVIPAQGGSLVFRLHVPGLSAHACMRNEGVSAIEKFSYLHAALLAFEAERNAQITHPLYAGFANKIPISIGVVRSGSWPSSVPESLIAEGRAGLVPGEDVATFRDAFVRVIDEAAAADPWLRAHPPAVEWFSGQFAPAEIPLDHPLVDLVGGAHESVTGRPCEVDASTYGADMRHFLHSGHTPCVMYGAGDVRVAHFTDEHVDVEDVVTTTKVLAIAAANWCR